MPDEPLSSTLASAATATGPVPALQALAAESEVERVLQICNACRYCEGYCAVFPAMTRRLAFPPEDVHYLAHLCHHCGACLHACQYAPPHEFAVNVPQAMARVRGRSHARFAWPAAFGRAYAHQGVLLALSLTLALALIVVLLLAGAGTLWPEAADGNFYALMPHNMMVGLFGPVFGWALLALAIGVRRFWVACGPQAAGMSEAERRGALREAGGQALKLEHLGGGHGLGCHNDDEGWTLWRRRFHHATFYGFMLCFAATVLATIYHAVFGRIAPYPLTSGPVLLGTLGGLSMTVGTLGLWQLHRRRHAMHRLAEQDMFDRSFIALLFLVATSGLVLLAGRATPALGLLLALHLGSVMALFITMPYGKFAHGAFRAAALWKAALEKRQPLELRLGGE